MTKVIAYNIEEHAVLFIKSRSHLEQAHGLMNLQRTSKSAICLESVQQHAHILDLRSTLPTSPKVSFLCAAVESILLYGTNGWTLTHRVIASGKILWQ